SVCVLGQSEPVGSVLTFPSGYDTLEYSWVKATAVSVRLRILFVTLQNTNRGHAGRHNHGRPAPLHRSCCVVTHRSIITCRSTSKATTWRKEGRGRCRPAPCRPPGLAPHPNIRASS